MKSLLESPSSSHLLSTATLGIFLTLSASRLVSSKTIGIYGSIGLRPENNSFQLLGGF